MATSAKVCQSYKTYFGMPVGDQDKPQAHHFICELCKRILEGKMKSFACLDGKEWKIEL